VKVGFGIFFSAGSGDRNEKAENLPGPGDPSHDCSNIASNKKVLEEIRRNEKLIKMLKKRIRKKDQMLENLFAKVVPPELGNQMDYS